MARLAQAVKSTATAAAGTAPRKQGGGGQASAKPAAGGTKGPWGFELGSILKNPTLAAPAALAVVLPVIGDRIVPWKRLRCLLLLPDEGCRSRGFLNRVRKSPSDRASSNG